MLLVLLLLCLGLYCLPPSLSRHIDLAPFLPARSALADTTDRATPAPDSALELERLRKQITDMKHLFEDMQYYSTAFRDDPPPMLGARIFLRGDTSSWRQTCYIDAGSDDGIFKGQAVADGQGLIGTISAVAKTYSRVALLTDPDSTVLAYIEDSTGTIYDVPAQGSAETTLTLKFASVSARIRPGDPVYTRGTKGLIPRNLLIGRVKAIGKNDSGLVHQVSLTPAGRPRTAVDVVVFLRTPPEVPAP